MEVAGAVAGRNCCDGCSGWWNWRRPGRDFPGNPSRCTHDRPHRIRNASGKIRTIRGGVLVRGSWFVSVGGFPQNWRRRALRCNCGCLFPRMGGALVHDCAPRIFVNRASRHRANPAPVLTCRICRESVAGKASASSSLGFRPSAAFTARKSCYRAAATADNFAMRSCPHFRKCDSLSRPALKRCLVNGQDQGHQPHRRDGWRRDDQDHLAVHQGQADPSLPRHQPDVFRPRHAEARRDARQDHGRGRGSDQEGRRRGEMRHHHAGRGAGEGIQPARNVPLAQRHHPQHPRRRHLPRADHLQERAAAGARLDAADHHRPPCLWRPVPRHRFQGARQGQALSQLRRRRRTEDRARGVPVPRPRRRHGDVQPRRFRSAISPAPR